MKDLRKWFKDFKKRIKKQINNYKKTKQIIKTNITLKFSDWIYSDNASVNNSEEFVTLRMGNLHEDFTIKATIKISKEDYKELKAFTDIGYRLLLTVDKIK